MDFKNEYFSYSVKIFDLGVKLSYTSNLEDHEVATYLFIVKNNENILLEKIWYQKNIQDKEISLESGKYFFVFYIRKKGEKKYLLSRKSEFINVKLLSSFIKYFFNPKTTDKVLRRLVDQNLNDIDFGHVRSAKHGSVKVSEDFYSTLCQSCLNILSENPRIDRSRSFLLNCIFYMADSSFLSGNKYKLILFLINSASISSEKDILFWYGLMMYKMEEYSVAEQTFEKLVSFKEQLSYHQTGSLSYLSDTKNFLDKDFNDVKINYIYKKTSKKTQGCILISCDFGYFSAYLKSILHAFDERLIVHLHLILPDNVEELNLSKISEKYENIFVSYEFVEKTIGNVRTYYSVSRYLILPEILNRYKLPTIVADADLDFLNIDLISVVTSVGDNEFALNIKDNDLPWLKVTAGFNVFGKNTGDADFFNVMIKYIRFCLETGKDGWMLDQTVLGQCLYFYSIGLIKTSSDFEINRLQLEKTVRQVTNRAKKRVEAKQALLTLNYH
ncbi:hypothetical protein ACTXGJ_07045 [Psychrobacter sp. 1Y11]|uniref:hypothetical protein n=1 Tax=Psychrobacter sp. 1Y11 TaxID=3457446 RepID=UPI003FD56D9B